MLNSHILITENITMSILVWLCASANILGDRLHWYIRLSSIQFDRILSCSWRVWTWLFKSQLVVCVCELFSNYSPIVQAFNCSYLYQASSNWSESYNKLWPIQCLMQSPIDIFGAQQTSNFGPNNEQNTIWIPCFVYDIDLLSFY